MGGQSKVIRLYRYLQNPISEEKCKGKVYCLIDTDQKRCEEINNGYKSLAIRRLSNKNSFEKTELLTLDNNDTSVTDIEKSLNPTLFQSTINELKINDLYKVENIVNESGNSDFIKNFRNVHLEDYFKENNGENKVLFANKYIELSNTDLNKGKVPEWINEIKRFFS